MPGCMILFQREIELERRHSTGIALYSRQFAAHAIRFEADEQRTASKAAGLILCHRKYIFGYLGQQIGR